MTLISRPELEPDVEHRVEVDWRLFEQAQMVEDVELQITSSKRHPT